MVNLALISFGVLISTVLYYTNTQIMQETLLPLVFLYHILTFSLAYQKADRLRKLIVSFALSFFEIVSTHITISENWPDKLRI